MGYENALKRQIPTGTVLFDENDLSLRMYVTREGSVKIYRLQNRQEMRERANECCL